MRSSCRPLPPTKFRVHKTRANPQGDHHKEFITTHSTKQMNEMLALPFVQEFPLKNLIDLRDFAAIHTISVLANRVGSIEKLQLEDFFYEGDD